MSTFYIGCDLGKKGGFVVLDPNGQIIATKVMPIQADEINILEIAKFLQFHRKQHDRTHLVMEKFAGFFGYSKMAAVSLAMQSGKVRAACVLVKLPFTAVTPKQWQKVVWEGTKIQFKKTKDGSKKDTKKTSILTAARLFPNESFLPSPRHKVPHDGLVDAALLAEFGRRKGF